MTERKEITDIASHYGFDSQCQILIEEMAELTKAICKYNRAKTSREKSATLLDLIEEIADVEIMIRQIKSLVDADSVEKAVEYKIARQIQRIKEEELEERIGNDKR